MTDEYTPTTEEVRGQWASSPVYGYRDPMPVRLAEFDRWLASVRADAWDEGAKAVVDLLGIKMVSVKPGEQFEQRPVNPYRSEKQ